MAQKFYADPNQKFVSLNGAIGYAPSGPMDCLGHFAKVANCPIAGTQLRLTCYATGYADTYFSIPACTRRKGKHISGYFTQDEMGVVFHPHDKHKDAMAV